MANIKLRDKTGTPTVYSNVNTLQFQSADSNGTVDFDY